MKLIKIFSLLALLFLAVIFITLLYFGAFNKIKIVEETIPAMTMIGTANVGAYQNVSPKMGKLYDAVKKAGVSGTKGVGIYFDSPETVVPEKCRAIIGQIISEQDLPKVKKLTETYPLTVIPEHTAKVVHFPYHGQLSIIIAVTKVYPVLKAAYGDSLSAASLEIYDIPNKDIMFIIPTTITRTQQEQWLTPLLEASKNHPDPVADSIQSPSKKVN